MTSQGFRLRKNCDIERVFRKGKPLFCASLGCRYAPSEGSPLAAFAVSKKQFPMAVSRNRLKRRMRESFRAYLVGGAVSPGEYVFFFTKQAKDPSFQEIKDCMRAIFAKVR